MQSIFVRPEDVELFEVFQSNLLAELKPSGELQTHLFEQIVHAVWNLRRCLALEIEIQTEAAQQGLNDALLDNGLAKKLDRIYRYKRTHESTERRALKDLRQLQTEALWRHTVNKFEEESIVVDTEKILDAAHRDAVQSTAARMNKPSSSFAEPLATLLRPEGSHGCRNEQNEKSVYLPRRSDSGRTAGRGQEA